MRKVRIIPRLDIKYPNLIKGIHLEGLRVMGNPAEFASRYYAEGADELLYMDSVASLYERNTIHTLIEETAERIFIPLTVGGGIRSVANARAALRSGADKIALNTAAIKTPDLIKEIAQAFGNQCVVVSIEAKQVAAHSWEAYTDNGREKTGMDVLEWIQKVQNLGAGELLITSVDQEGTHKGFDVDLLQAVMNMATIPVIASGGMGSLQDLIHLIEQTQVDAVAIASVLHKNILSLGDIRQELLKHGFEVPKQ